MRRANLHHRKETAELLAWLAELGRSGRRAALATVVAIEGSAYRRPGAKLLVAENGEARGGVSGGCLEADVREVARAVLASGEPVLRTYDSRTHEEVIWGLGLGCDGRVDIFVQPASEGPFAALAARFAVGLAGEEPWAVATRLAGAGSVPAALLVGEMEIHGTLGSAAMDRLVTERLRPLARPGRSRILEIEGERLFVDLAPPPIHLVVCGAGDDAQPLVAYAADAGFRVDLVDHRPALLTRERFPAAHALVLARPDDAAASAALPEAGRALAVVKTHSYAHDRDWTKRLLAAGIPFVGLLGPRERQERLRKEIGAENDTRLHGPVGLDLGAQGAHQIAISIVAELLAFHTGREPLPLAHRRLAIHAGS